MGCPKKRQEPDEAPGAPEWMVTFSDCMTLLLTFFVLLLSFSSFDERVFRKLKVVFASSLTTVSYDIDSNRDALLAAREFQHSEELDKGSEKPTLIKGTEDNLMEETEYTDFHSRKVFLIPSRRVFWGEGAVVSRQGRELLSIMASFLKETPNRIVISENTRGGGANTDESDLGRAWAVMEYLTAGQGLDKSQFSISAASTVTREFAESGESARSPAKKERMLEIVLLERSIYN